MGCPRLDGGGVFWCFWEEGRRGFVLGKGENVFVGLGLIQGRIISITGMVHIVFWRVPWKILDGLVRELFFGQ